MADSQVQAQPDEGDSPVKTRAACDECRTKKLKCTGERPSCARCVRESITCVYSPQKQMGRPKKRARTEQQERAEVEQNLSKDSSPPHGTWDLHTSGTNGYGLGIREWDSTLIPGWNLPPWMKGSSETWDFNNTPPETAIPSLTPDSSSNSPPTLNLPAELQHISLSHHNHQNNPPNNDASTNLLLDPSLTGTNPTLLPACACLPTLYLTLNTLQTMDTTFPFPFALHPLREAMHTAAHVLACRECPTRFISAVQNTQLVGTLLVSIAERFGRILAAITAEAVRAEAAGERKTFRLADLNTSTLHLHTGGISCAAAFSIDLSPTEWRGMAKKVVRAEVEGGTEACCSCFIGLLDLMEERQNYFHSCRDHGGEEVLPEDFPVDSRTGRKMGGGSMPKEDHLCLKLVGYARRLVEGFDWS